MMSFWVEGGGALTVAVRLCGTVWMVEAPVPPCHQPATGGAWFPESGAFALWSLADYIGAGRTALIYWFHRRNGCLWAADLPPSLPEMAQ